MKAAGIFAAILIASFAGGYFLVSFFQQAPTTGNVVTKEPLTPPERPGFESYATADFYVYYPEGWRPRKILNEYSTVEIGFVSPRQINNDSFIESVLITSDLLSRNMSLKDYVTVSLLRLQTQIIPNFYLLSTAPRQVGGADGFEIVFTGNDTINPLIKYRQVFVKADAASRMYVLTYTAREKAFDTFAEEADAIIGSFTLAENANA